MKPAPFEYFAPGTMNEALELVAAYGDSQKVLAGGQSLVPLLNMRLARPDQLIDLNRVAGLDDQVTEGDTIEFGSMVRLASVEKSTAVAAAVPILPEALRLVGHVANRSRGTVGGTLAHADPTAETALAWLLHEGKAMVSSPSGQRTIAADDFFETYFTPALAEDEIVTRVTFERPPPGSGAAIFEIAPRAGDLAIVDAAVLVTVRDGSVADARVAIGGVADRPLRIPVAEQALIGQPLGSAAYEIAAEAVADEISPQSDIHASADYRRRVSGVLTRRALEQAAARATGEQRP